MKRLPHISLSSLKAPASVGALAGLVKEKGSHKVSVIGAVVGAGMDTISATRDERAFLSKLVDEYRPEIAKRLGVSEKQVTAEHFNEAFKENPVLAQAKEATAMKRMVRVVSNAVSLTAGAAAGLGASIFVRRGQKVEGMQQNAADIAGALAASFGGMAAGQMTRKVLHIRGRETSLEDTAHGQIMVIKNKQQLGEPTDATDIFKVQLAVNTQVRDAISKEFGKPFAEMGKEEQLNLMKNEFGDILAANDEMARRINEGARPQGIIFGDVEDVKVKAESQKPAPAPLHDKAAEELGAPIAVAAPAAPKQEAHDAPPQPFSEQPLPQVEQPKVTVDTPAALSPEDQQRLIRTIEEGVAKHAAQEAPVQQEAPEYTKEQHEAVQGALKEALRRKMGAPSHAETLDRERSNQGELQHSR
ncbi:MAG: hypothetical protein FJX23_04840 [Alphaproteobacteria bacterium]|nr:hypothetical protein [Alphaproteobacteria bacterium]